MRTSGHRLAAFLILLAALCGAGGARAQTPAAPAPTPLPPTVHTPAAPAPSKSEPVAIDAPGGKLRGTLELPARGAAPYPVALIIAGSGPTDRNGDSTVIPGA